MAISGKVQAYTCGVFKWRCHRVALGAYEKCVGDQRRVTIITFVVPSFQSLIHTNRLNTEVNTLVSALQLARSEAVKRGAEVRVAAVGGDWSAGFCVTSSDNDPCEDDDGNRLRVFEAIELPLDTNATPPVTEVIFNRMGELVSANALTFDISLPSCPPR